MRLAAFTTAALLGAASPALATGTITCRSTTSPTDGPALTLVVGTGGITQARLTQGGAPFTTGAGAGAPTIGQSWIDRYQLKLDILDANADALIARLDTRRRAGSVYLGRLILHGRTWRVRCQESG